jgi:hypothetical protein
VCNNVRQEIRKPTKVALGHAVVVGHIDEWHPTSLV